MSHSLTLNQSISNSLTYLDLSGNSLKDDITVSSSSERGIFLDVSKIFQFLQNLHNFLAQPNVLEHLDLASTDITLENVSISISIEVPVLIFGLYVFAVVWCSVARLRHAFGPPERVAQLVQHQEGQRDPALVQAVLYQHLQFKAPQYRRLQTSHGGIEEPAAWPGLQRVYSRTLSGSQQ